MKRYIVNACAVFIEAAVFLLLPPVKLLIPEAESAAGYELILLPFIVFPAVCWGLGVFSTLAAGFSPVPAAAAGLLFVPASLISYGAASFTFAGVYTGACLAGSVSAYPIRAIAAAKRAERKTG